MNRIHLKVLMISFIGICLVVVTSGCYFKKAGPNPPKSPDVTPEKSTQTNKLSEKPVDPSEPLKTASPQANISFKQNQATDLNTTEKRYDQVPVLYYHSVMIQPGNELRMPPDQFEDQIKYLAEHGYHGISLDQLYENLYGSGTLPDKPIVITFDDGYKDNYTNAFPILKKYGYTATVFAVTDYVNGDDFMTWDQLLELADNGWEIEGHTKDHPYLVKDKLDSTSLSKELKESKDILERHLGHPIKYFAYPFGDYNVEIAQKVKDAGYLLSFTTERGWAKRGANSMMLHRVYCYANMGIQEFARRISNPEY